MTKPRIFLGSSGKQEKLLQALTRGLEDVAHVEPWTTSFNPGITTLERLLELTREVDFAAFVFAHDDWTTQSPQVLPAPESGQASPRDNVVFEAGLFGGTLGMRRTFILHANGSKLPSDLLGPPCVRYEATTPTAVRVINQKLRQAVETEGRLARIEGLWWQFSLTERSLREPSAVSPLRISRGRGGALGVGRAPPPPAACAGSRAIATVPSKWPAARGRRMGPSRQGTGAKPRRRGSRLRAFSTTGKGNGRDIPTLRNWKGPEKFSSSPPIAPRGTSPLART